MATARVTPSLTHERGARLTPQARASSGGTEAGSLPCRQPGIGPVVTFHHCTSPRWVAAAGGGAEAATAHRFARYCERAAGHLGDLVARACTINEPNIVAMIGYLAGAFPPGRRDRDLRHRANDVFITAHRLAADAIRSARGAPVGLTLAMSDYQAVDGGDERRDHIRAGMEDVFLEATGGDDF